MDKPTLEERCAELKLRMLAGRPSENETAATTTTGSNFTRQIHQPSKAAPVRVQPEAPTVQLRDPHPMIKAALSAKNDIPDEYGKFQFRFHGHADIRVSRPVARRALKILDTLFKRLEKEGFVIQIAPRETGYYQRGRRYTLVTDGRAQVQLTVTEKTVQRLNPAWNEEKRWSAARHLSTRLAG